MTDIINFLVCGNDMRQNEIANALYSDGYNVSVIGLNCDYPQYDEMLKALENCNCVILPLPCSRDGVTVSGTDIKIDDIIGYSNNDTLIFGGKLTDKLKLSGLKVFDYYEREELAIYNAIPTAEGALQLAMEMLPVTIHGSKCLVLGYGRIGKIMSEYLKSLGAKVTVEARKFSDYAWIEARGMKYLRLADIEKYINNFNLIINTVPNLIIDSKILSKVRKDALIIDLASMPGGVDFDCALKRGIKAIHALSLPAKVAPVTAGIIVKNTVINMLEEMGCEF